MTEQKADLNLTLFGKPVQIELSFPVGRVQSLEVLPAVRALDDALIRHVTEAAEEAGFRVSCRKGCAACCRKMVLLSPDEVRHIQTLVANLEEKRKAEIRARFVQAKGQLLEAGLLDPLLDSEDMSEEELGASGLHYFELGIPCPFLEQETCAIYPERPFACREYLVTSPPEFCFPESPVNDVDQLNLPAYVSRALGSLRKRADGRSAGWVPLTLALDRPETESPACDAFDMIREVVDRIVGKSGLL